MSELLIVGLVGFWYTFGRKSPSEIKEILNWIACKQVKFGAFGFPKSQEILANTYP